MTEDTDEDAPAPPPAAKTARARPTSRKQVIANLWRAARTQLAAHEAHLAELPSGQAASEADAKTLATLARTVRELVALDAGFSGQGGKSEDDISPADTQRRMADLRAELARRMERLVAQHAGEAVSDDAAGPAAGAA